MKLKLKNKDTVIIIVLVALVLITRFGLAIKKDEIEINLNNDNSSISVEVEEEILVHISGEVNNPGVYELKSSDRLDDLVLLSGGMTDNADNSRVNLARILEDGLKIHIPSKSIITKNMKSLERLTLTDFNQLSSKELQEIDGIGEVISKRIVDYRDTNGPFKKISDLLNVNGIGDSKLEIIMSKVY